MRRLRPVLLALLLAGLAACAFPAGEREVPAPPTSPPTTAATQATEPPSEPTEEEQMQRRIDGLIEGMTLREQVSQLFLLSLTADDGAVHSEPGEALDAFLDSTRAGGYVLFTEHVSTVEGTRALTDAIRRRGAIAPFLGIDEEGGSVSRLSSAGLPGYENQATAAAIGRGGDPEKAYQAGLAIGAALEEIGVNLDFAPCADVLVNPANPVVGDRSYGSDPALVADMASGAMRGLGERNILTSPKHFPGHGSTAEDSHDGLAVNPSTAEELEAVEYVPFRRLIAEGAPFVMLGHLLVPEVDGSGLPASLSPHFATAVLRGELGFEGVVITDAMAMGAIVENHPSGEAAVLALQAGVDMILMPEDFDEALEAVLAALEDGTLPEARVRESLTRVLRLKLEAGLIHPTPGS